MLRRKGASPRTTSPFNLEKEEFFRKEPGACGPCLLSAAWTLIGRYAALYRHVVPAASNWNCFPRFFPAMKTLDQRRALREQIVALLKAGDFQALTVLAGQESGVAAQLLNFLFSPEELLQWRAVEGLGHVAAAHPEQVRKVIGRLLYQLNEDSGSSGWGAAAALGEIGRRHLPLVEDILPMFCGFLKEKFSRASMLWGLGRLWEMHPGVLEEATPLLFAFLEDPDPQVRGLAVWCLGRVRPPAAKEALKGLLRDDSAVELYDQERLRRTSVGRLAREALGGRDKARAASPGTLGQKILPERG